nr:restriction endonuclease subunit S [Streptococcus equi]
MDRLGWFLSDSSIRANLDLKRFYEIKIPIPDIHVQQSIVDIYNAYITRKQINERLKQQIKDICPILIAGAIKERMRMPKFTEAQLEEAIIELFQEQGYDYINGDKLHRKYDEILLKKI